MPSLKERAFGKLCDKYCLTKKCPQNEKPSVQIFGSGSKDFQGLVSKARSSVGDEKLEAQYQEFLKMNRKFGPERGMSDLEIRKATNRNLQGYAGTKKANAFLLRTGRTELIRKKKRKS